MKRFFVLTFLSLATVFAGAQNLIENSSFEEGKIQNGRSRILPGWSVRSYTAKMHRVAAGGSDGKRAAVIHTDIILPGKKKRKDDTWRELLISTK